MQNITDINIEEKRDTKKIIASEFAKRLSLSMINTNLSDKEIELYSLSVNRPGLFLAGFEEYFANSRIQVIGNAEFYFIENLSQEEKKSIFTRLCKTKIPCIIFSRNLEVSDELIKIANTNDIPLFKTTAVTSFIINDIIDFLNDFLSEVSSIQAELLEINGVGVLITGISGLGKSETALDLITRGHKLVADDIVEIKRVKNNIIGTAPKKIRHYMEVRGLGIINVPKLYGIGSVLNSKRVELIIELKRFVPGIKVERLGNETEYRQILGINIPLLIIPVDVGRNLANIVEVASNNFRLKQLGTDALKEFISDTMN